MLFTTSGAASCPLFTPIEKVKATCSWPTFCVLISFSSLYRVLAKFFAGMLHCPSSGGAAATGATTSAQTKLLWMKINAKAATAVTA